ncbi:hypothetical protein KJY73_00460 [Bowmanella sp. Y26]|uniref:hypothetical protein n=1 Tax=Bowmanella yangjiangensis TaxID=2811230 RepID=UPI001BDD7BA2|nr:hypothetical protein [Bowmanella yangjiangensis]MBT1062015.1 hypothetical protein [Bowmanella yangjiangensis]
MAIKKSCLLLLALSASSLAATDCPEQFHQLPLVEKAGSCHIFDDKLPATLSYFSALTPAQTLAFYQDQLSDALQSQSKDRQVLEDKQGRWVVVISADGKGSQIDMLVKE